MSSVKKEAANGVNVIGMAVKLPGKIEVLMLYMIELKKRMSS